MVIIDTSIIIDHFRRPAGVETVLKRFVKNFPKELVVISMITIQELYEGKSTGKAEIVRYLLTVLASFKILNYSYETAKLAGELIRDSKKPLEFADAAIAATAIVNGGKLLTLNRKDFSEIENLELAD